MLIEFSVKNFLCFRDKVTLSMEKGTDKEHLNNVFSINNTNLLKTAVIYGANASGKSSLLKALTAAILTIRGSNTIAIGEKLNLIKSFAFDEKIKKLPSEFEFVFFTNNIKYRYFFSADNEKIYEEVLEAYYSQKATTIFKRSDVNKYKFLITDEKILKSIETKNTENKLFLATATNWNYEKTKDVYLWFMNSIDTYDDFGMSIDELSKYKESDNNLKDFTIKLLKEADIFIKDLNVEFDRKEIENDPLDLFVPRIGRYKQLFMATNIKIDIFHEITDENNEKHVYSLDFNEESKGTKVLFSLAPILKRSFENSKVIIADELEKSLHPLLVEYLIKIFNNKSINKSNSQLIFTTHAANLLDLNLFRRDQIWFTEKNANIGNAELFSLYSYSVRKDENIQKGYLTGRYGAIPFIKDVDLWQEE